MAADVDGPIDDADDTWLLRTDDPWESTYPAQYTTDTS